MPCLGERHALGDDRVDVAFAEHLDEHAPVPGVGALDSWLESRVRTAWTLESCRTGLSQTVDIVSVPT